MPPSPKEGIVSEDGQGLEMERESILTRRLESTGCATPGAGARDEG